MGLIKITSTMTEAERIAAYNSNMQYLEKDLPLKHLPVGIIISFDTPVNPSELYGGKWERIKGRFIWGIEDGGQGGDTGGEKTHTLTWYEMPDHYHYYNSYANGFPSQLEGIDRYKTAVRDNVHTTESVAGTQTNVAGGGQPHNNMPPYYGAYTWRRVA